LAPLERFAVEPPLVWPGQPFSPGLPEAQGIREAWFLDCRVPQKHSAALDFEAVFWPFSRGSPGRRRAVLQLCRSGLICWTMLLASSVSRLFKWRQFEPEVIRVLTTSNRYSVNGIPVDIPSSGIFGVIDLCRYAEPMKSGT
jgi:hypothetical protein